MRTYMFISNLTEDCMHEKDSDGYTKPFEDIVQLKDCMPGDEMSGKEIPFIVSGYEFCTHKHDTWNESGSDISRGSVFATELFLRLSNSISVTAALIQLQQKGDDVGDNLIIITGEEERNSDRKRILIPGSVDIFNFPVMPQINLGGEGGVSIMYKTVTSSCYEKSADNDVCTVFRGVTIKGPLGHLPSKL